MKYILNPPSAHRIINIIKCLVKCLTGLVVSAVTSLGCCVIIMQGGISCCI